MANTPSQPAAAANTPGELATALFLSAVPPSDMRPKRGSLEVEDLLKIILVLVIVWIAVEIIMEIISFVFAPISSLVGILIIILIVAYFLDYI